ncbi:MAG: ATP-grasp domain-containing protein [Deltaproteobacteria bacterium]|nr:ATP-grasp domain-containing protein [Deltaproteobacteria bacterium]
MARVLVAYGTHRLGRDRQGRPSLERHIVSTVASVEAALTARGHRVERAAVQRDVRRFVARVRRFRPDVVFNLCEQVAGDATQEKNAAALFELARLRFTGNPSLALGLCQEKALAKRLLRTARLATPEFTVVPPGATIEDFDLPAMVKPARTDGSLGISARSVVKSRQALKDRVAYVHRRFAQPALVERFVAGREFQVALLGNHEPEVLAVAELSYAGLPRGVPRICSYSAKWRPLSAYYRFTKPVVPAHVRETLRRSMEQSALRAFKLLGLRGYARVDFRVGRGQPKIIDINPNPDISPDAGMTRAAEHAGLSYDDLVERLVRLALE